MDSIFYSPNHPAGYSGISALADAASTTHKKAALYLNKQPIYRAHKVPQRKFKRSRYRVDGVGIQFQADLFDVSKFGWHNNGNKWVVLVVDAFSRYVACEPAKNKSGPEIAKRLDIIFTRLREQSRMAPTSQLATDLGNEFFNKHADEVYKRHNISHFPLRAPIKCGLAEISGRYVMGRLYKIMQHNDTKRWIESLPDVVEAKNSRKSRKTAGLAPVDINFENQHLVHASLYPQDSPLLPAKLQVGDRVQVVKNRLPFAKSYQGYYADRTYYVAQVHVGDVPRYTIADGEDDVRISGTYYDEELYALNST